MEAGFADAPGLGIVGAAAGAAGCLRKIRDLIMLKASAAERFLGMPDSVASHLDFPEWTRLCTCTCIYLSM